MELACSTSSRASDHLGERGDLSGTSYPAANQQVERLVKCDVLAGMTGQVRHWRFHYNAHVRIFDERQASLVKSEHYRRTKTDPNATPRFAARADCPAFHVFAIEPSQAGTISQ
jgi:hypothetical protein